MRRILFIILSSALFFIGNIHAQVATSDSLVMHYLQQQGIPVTANNEVKLLMSGREKFLDLFEEIRHAKHHIHLEYFNFRNDSIANALFDLLAEKVQEGVEVRALFDAFGNWSNNKPLKKHHLKAIRDRGIEIVKFDPITFPWINHAMHRDHRKIVVIDGKIGYTGGMNIADYYITGLPKIGQWHDMHMRIEGDAVRYLQGIFLTMWNQETKQHVGGPVYFPDIPQLPDSIAEEIAIVDRTPAVSDIPFTPEASFYIVHKLMKKGAKVYLFNGGFHHSKIMMVDRNFCTVGTANLNSRSLRYDFETNAFIFDPTITHQLNDMFERDKKNSTLLTPEVWKKRSGWKKFVGWVGNLMTPFL